MDTNVFTLITIFATITYKIILNFFNSIIIKKSYPLGIIPWSINNIVQTRISYKRIIDYLNLPSIDTNDII
jgi:hypothetical protein